MTSAQLRARECVIALRDDGKANPFRGIAESVTNDFQRTDFHPTNDAAAVAIVERAIEAAFRDEHLKAHRR